MSIDAIGGPIFLTPRLPPDVWVAVWWPDYGEAHIVAIGWSEVECRALARAAIAAHPQFRPAIHKSAEEAMGDGVAVQRGSVSVQRFPIGKPITEEGNV